MINITQELKDTLAREFNHMANLRHAFMEEHCLNGQPGDNCPACMFAKKAVNKYAILKKQQALQLEMDAIRKDHVRGDDPGLSGDSYGDFYPDSNGYEPQGSYLV